jgi:hypothetical protein
MFVLSWATVVYKAKPEAKSREMTVTAGAESILLLLMVPEMDVLTLQIERERSKKVLSSEWKATAKTAKKKTVSDTKTILWIRERCIVLLFPCCLANLLFSTIYFKGLSRDMIFRNPPPTFS